MQQFKTCEDFEKEGRWDTSLCCEYCHGDYLHDGSEHEMRNEPLDGQPLDICIPLYEQLFNGASHFVPEAE